MIIMIIITITAIVIIIIVIIFDFKSFKASTCSFPWSSIVFICFPKAFSKKE